MNQVEAFVDTLTLAQERGMADCDFEVESVNYWHLQDMLEQIKTEPERFSEAKLGRWLGWAQCAVVAGMYATLDEMKQINQRHSGNES